MKSKKGLIFVILAVLCLVLSSCEKEKIRVIAPYGGPSYATMFLDGSYEIDEVAGADPLVAAFGAKNYDVIIAPTNLGAKFYNMSPDYQLLASIVWGNFFLVSKSEISLEEIEGKKIQAFGKNQTPDIILSYLLSKNELTCEVEYLSSITEVIANFQTEDSGIYLVTEPQLSSLEVNIELNYIDLQEAYKDISRTNSYPQASIFVSSQLSSSTVRRIERDMKDSIDSLNDEANADQIWKEIEVSVAAIQRSHIEYKAAEDIESDVSAYLEVIIDFNSKILDKLPDSGFYK